MAKKRLRKDEAIQMVLSEVEKGSSRKEALSNLGKKWQLSVRSFDRYWGIAKRQYHENQKKIQSEIQKERTKAAKERLRKGIITREERLNTASNIAKGKARKAGKAWVYPSDSERIKALDYISKIEGDYAPTKMDHTTKGESLNTPFLDFLMKATEDEN